MLLRLIPSSPVRIVLFNLSFSNLPDSIPFPPNWTAQLHQLANDDLETPQVSHVLDKSTWIISLLKEVTFDLTCLTVTCLFIDGTTEEWPLMRHACTQLLESVLQDVNKSAVEDYAEEEQVAGPPGIPLPTSPSTKKHKKSRSLLMSIVAMLVPSISLSSPIKELASRPSSPASPSPSSPVPPAEPPISPRRLRRRARSNLVDAYRRFVATELTKRVSPGGYYNWIVESLLRRQQEQMRSIVAQADGIVPELNFDSPLTTRVTISPFHSHYTTQSSSTYYEDDGDGQSIAGTTDTDGSSVHTPTDLPTGQRLQYAHRIDVPRTPSPPCFSPEDIELYALLNRQCLRLRQILYRAQLYQANLENEEKHISSVLEIKSRRRAWSNRQYCGGAPMAYIGLATPFQSSSLAKCEPSTAEDWIQCDLTGAFGSLSLSTADHDLSELFPTVEEYEDAVENEAEAQLVWDLEMGLLKPVQDGFARAPIRVRRRSTLMSNPLDLDNDFSQPSPRLSSSSFHCQPFNPCPQNPKDLPGKREAIYDPDFALNMDLRPRYFARDDDLSFHDREWIRPPGPVVDYR